VHQVSNKQHFAIIQANKNKQHLAQTVTLD
jgi:hypothetical protein